jgi:hypothetical protein
MARRAGAGWILILAAAVHILATALDPLVHAQEWRAGSGGLVGSEPSAAGGLEPPATHADLACLLCRVAGSSADPAWNATVAASPEPASAVFSPSAEGRARPPLAHHRPRGPPPPPASPPNL